MIAEIIINITAKRLQQTFSYLVPETLDVHIGSRVLVPFGHRNEEGIIVNMHPDDGIDKSFTLKPIIKSLSSQYGFQEEIIETASWISNYYLCNFSDALRLFMIDKKGLVKKDYLSVSDNLPELLDSEQELYQFIQQRQPIEKKQVIKKFPSTILENLIAKGILIQNREEINKIADKTAQFLTFAKPDEQDTLKKRPRQKQLLAELSEQGTASVSYWLKKGFSRKVIYDLAESGFATLESKIKSTTDLTQHLTGDTPWNLTPEQQHAVDTIEADTKGNTYLLHGVTGSGKTEVYMKLTEKILAQGKQVIVLVPEIALTGQIVRRFIRRFGNDVVIQHSQLSKGERKNNWQRMMNKESHICIGARSAIFTAVADLGLIIIDEEHDGSYKQDESPRYQAVEVAKKRAAYYHCPVILGSATPAINDYHKAELGDYILLELPYRVAKRPLPTVKVVDMRDELSKGNFRVISDDLADLLRETLANKQQAIILLNRRGFSTFVMCRKCGYVVKCETCDVAMVYHKDQNKLKCHYCENEKPVPTVCPACGSKYIKFFGTGTQRVEEQLHEMFPDARIIRLDQDSTTRKNSSDQIIEAFRSHQYDILLGTQMVAKGHDFPDVSAVGILAADSLLNLPVYWAGERTFQLLTQAAGRAGRGDVPGKVVMQTYAPEHYVIKCSEEQDYKTFFAQELKYRQELDYPPYTHIIKIIITYEDDAQTWDTGHKLAYLLNQWKTTDTHVEIIGPYIDTIKKIRNKYRVIILIKGIDLMNVKKYIKNEAEFHKTGIIIDVDPTF